jgi:shikimate dehydrogenase
LVEAIRESPLQVLVLGAGGSARAVVYSLANVGWTVTVAARRIEQAQELATCCSPLVNACSFSELSALDLSTLSLIVNTTPIGMSPNINASPWPVGLAFPQNALVYDLIYNPRETLFVRQARAAGLCATTGLGMLVEQAALSFERWTGCTPPRDVMFNAVN